MDFPCNCRFGKAQFLDINESTLHSPEQKQSYPCRLSMTELSNPDFIAIQAEVLTVATVTTVVQCEKPYSCYQLTIFQHSSTADTIPVLGSSILIGVCCYPDVLIYRSTTESRGNTYNRYLNYCHLYACLCSYMFAVTILKSCSILNTGSVVGPSH